MHAVLLAAAGVVRFELPLLRRRVASARRRSCSSTSTARRSSSHPLAGTAPRTGDPTTDARVAAELIASTKDQVEHRVVIDTIYDTLLPYCSYLDWEPEPSVLTVANVQHLATRMEGRLSEPRPSVLDARPRAVADAGARRRAPRRGTAR